MADNWWEGDSPASPIDAASAAEGASPQEAAFARSIYHQESGSGKNTTTSNAGAVGGMQITPGTFGEVADKGWDINDPMHNARAGFRYAKKMLDKADGDPAIGAAGYYGGPGGLEKARKGVAVRDPRNPNAPDTLQYGKQVADRIPTGDNWWESDAIAGDKPAARTDTASQAPAAPQKPVAPTDNTMGPPVSAKAPGAWEAIGHMAAHPIDSAKAIGAAVSKKAGEVVDQVENDPVAAAKGGLLGVANGLTFGGFKKYAQPALSMAVNGGSFEDAQHRVKDMYEAAGPSTAAGEIGSILVPGLGQASLANAAIKAVPTASRLAKVAAGAGAGAVEGAANYVGHTDGPMNLSDASAYAAMGALPGGVMGAANKHTEKQLGTSFIKKAGDDETARMQAEILGDINAKANSSTGNGGIKAKQLNKIEEGYVKNVERPLKESGQLTNDMKYAIQDRDGMGDLALESLGNKGNNEAVLADAITKAQVMRTMTAQQEAKGGIRKGLRVAVDNGLLAQVPVAGWALGLAPVRHTVLKLLGGGQSREQVAGKLLKPKQQAMAQAAMKMLGPSAASAGTKEVKQMATKLMQERADEIIASKASSAAADASNAPFGTAAGRSSLDASQKATEKAAADLKKQAEKAKVLRDAQQASNLAASVKVREAQALDRRAADSAETNQLAQASQEQSTREAANAAARAQATQSNMANSLKVRQTNSEAARGQVAQEGAQVAKGAAEQSAMDMQNLAEKAKRAQASRSKLEAKEKAAQGDAPARTAARNAQTMQKKVDAVASGDFTGLDEAHPHMQHMLAYVEHPGMSEVKAAISDIAKTNPELGATAVKVMTHDGKKTNYYPLQAELQKRFKARQPTAEDIAKIPGAPKAPEASNGALSQAMSIEDELRKSRYAGGKAARKNYGAETAKEAPSESTRDVVQKMAMESKESKREVLFNAAYDAATDAEKKFMDRKVRHMIHYKVEE